MQISNQPLCHTENYCFAQIRGLAPARGAGKRLVWEGARLQGENIERRGGAADGTTVHVPHLIASSVTPKVGGIGGIC